MYTVPPRCSPEVHRRTPFLFVHLLHWSGQESIKKLQTLKHNWVQLGWNDQSQVKLCQLNSRWIVNRWWWWGKGEDIQLTQSLLTRQIRHLPHSPCTIFQSCSISDQIGPNQIVEGKRNLSIYYSYLAIQLRIYLNSKCIICKQK